MHLSGLIIVTADVVELLKTVWLWRQGEQQQPREREA
jgi:hypothetical protein